MGNRIKKAGKIKPIGELIDTLCEKIEDNSTADQDNVFYNGVVCGVLLSGNDAQDIKNHLREFQRLNTVQPMTDKQAIFWRVGMELDSAMKKHPETDNFDINKMALVMTEEAGEVAKAVLQYQDEDGDMEDVRSELIQTAAMCVRMLLATKDYKPKYK